VTTRWMRDAEANEPDDLYDQIRYWGELSRQQSEDAGRHMRTAVILLFVTAGVLLSGPAVVWLFTR
jgi:hypothetical protein